MAKLSCSKFLPTMHMAPESSYAGHHQGRLLDVEPQHKQDRRLAPSLSLFKRTTQLFSALILCLATVLRVHFPTSRPAQPGAITPGKKTFSGAPKKGKLHVCALQHFYQKWSARIVVQERLLRQVYCAAQRGCLVHGLVVL